MHAGDTARTDVSSSSGSAGCGGEPRVPEAEAKPNSGGPELRFR